MRVLHVLPTRAGAYGGPVRVAEAYCAQLLRAGHHAEIFSADSVTAPGLRAPYWPGVRGLRALADQARTADLMHIHGLWTIPTSAAAAWGRVLDRPFVITPHGMLDQWSLRHHATRKRLYAALIERANLNAAAALHFFNGEERQEASALGLKAPTFLLPNGVDVEQFADLPDRHALWDRYPETRGKKVVLFLGRLHPKKGLPLLVQALARLAPEIALVIAGPDEGGHRAQIEALVATERVQERVVFTGPVAADSKRLLLGGADVFVLASHQEGDSVAVKEALASGLPVIITRACHFPQVAREPAGLVIDPSVDELARALEQLCGDDALRARLAANARPLIEREYRWDLLGARMLQQYEELLARHRSHAVS